MSNEPADEEVMDHIRARLIQTGDWQRISKLLKARLEETGYDDDLKDLAKETARKQDEPKLSNLLDIITPKARDMMDPQTKAAVLQEIEAALEREVEKA